MRFMSDQNSQPADDSRTVPAEPAVAPDTAAKPRPGERPHPDPTRYGDWEKNGRCIDF
jgi:hypothetical protein